MIILILINVVFIIYIIKKYYSFPKEVYERNENSEICDENSLLLSYIDDRKLKNNFDLILAEIIELNIKGYITIEYNRESIDKYYYVIKQNIDKNAKELDNYEMLVLNFLFFDKNEITKNELEEKFRNTFKVYNLQYNELGEMLDKMLTQEEVIDVGKEAKLKKETKSYMKLLIASIFIIIILNAVKIMNISILNITLYLMANITSLWLLANASVYTIKGQTLKYDIDEYKSKIENEEYLVNKNTMNEIVKNKQFANSIALHIETEAKKAFLDDKILKEAAKKSKDIGFIIFAGLNIALFTLIIITIAVPKELVAWIYLILVLAIACSADIAFSYSQKK